MRKIVISNQKGGSGKTTTAVNLAAGLAEKGKKVLLVDLDPGSSATMWLLGNEHPDMDNDLFDLQGGPELIQELALETSVPNLEFIPFSPIRIRNSKALKEYPNKSFILKRKFDALPRNSYDYVLFDTGPGLTLTNINALAACKEIIVPVVAQSLTLYGVISLLETMESVQVKINPDLHISGILTCRVDPGNRHNTEVHELLTERFGVLVFNNFIREDSKLAESPSFMQTIFQYDSKCQGAQDYRAVCSEIIAQENKK
ncbi:MAG: ParA family protein [Leptospiraceae bacterium]|nr:ParA family protein [Leptospiraceae bacterium]